MSCTLFEILFHLPSGFKLDLFRKLITVCKTKYSVAFISIENHLLNFHNALPIHKRSWSIDFPYERVYVLFAGDPQGKKSVCCCWTNQNLADCDVQANHASLCYNTFNRHEGVSWMCIEILFYTQIVYIYIL